MPMLATGGRTSGVASLAPVCALAEPHCVVITVPMRMPTVSVPATRAEGVSF